MEYNTCTNNDDKEITQGGELKVESKPRSGSISDVNIGYNRSATVMVFGAPETGKSAVIARLVNNYFRAPSLSNTTEEHETLTIRSGKEQFKIQFLSPFLNVKAPWSLAVEDALNKADAFLLIYAVNCRESLETAIAYREKIGDVRGYTEKVPVLLVGNKVDLITERIVIPAEAELRALHWDTAVLEVSAKTAHGFSELKRNIFQMLDFPPRLYMTRRKSSLQKLLTACISDGSN